MREEQVDKLRALPPRFISFEGTEGVGKTTAMDGFCQWLTQCGIDFVRTREPGGSVLAERLRAHLLDPTVQMSFESEILLVYTARSDHLSQTILPALAAGKWVICDRFTDSTFAYQGFGRCFGNEEILKKIETLTKLFVPRLPDVSFWLDLQVKVGLARAGKRGALDRIEQESIDFFERVHAGFLHQAQMYPKRVQRIDASGTMAEVQSRLQAVLLAS